MKETLMELPSILGVLPWAILLLIGVYVWAIILPNRPESSTTEISWILRVILMAVISSFTVFVDPKILLGFFALFIGGLMENCSICSRMEKFAFAVSWVGLYMVMYHVVSLVFSGYPMLGNLA